VDLTGGAAAAEFSRSLTLSEEDATKSPVKRVVELLRKISVELQNEGANESSMYDKMVCWCKTQSSEKTTEVADLEQQEIELESVVGEQAETAAKAKVQLATAEKELKQHQDDLEKNQQLCDAQGAQSFEATKDLRFFITSLKNAIEVLSRHHAGLAQISAAEDASLRTVMQSAVVRFGLLKASSQASNKVALLSLGGHGATDLDQQLMKMVGADNEELPLSFAASTLEQAVRQAPRGVTGFLQSSVSPHLEKYSVQSGEILGILKQMLSDFEEELVSEQGLNSKALEECKSIKALKGSQIALTQKAILELQEQAATATSKGAEANHELDLTREQHAEATQFLQNLKVTCNDLDSQWEKRSHTRSEELRAVQETLAILTEDTAADHLRKQFSFVQIESASMRVTRSRVVASLQHASKDPVYQMDDLLDAWRSHGQRARAQLSTLAARAQLDSFTEVKKAIDKMIANLKAEGAADLAKKEFCTRDLGTAEKNSQSLTFQKTELASKIDQLNKKIATLTADMVAARAAISEEQTEVLKRGEQRDNANAEFQQIVADQRTTQQILHKALDRLEAFYSKGHQAAAAQGDASLAQGSQTPPVKFSTYSNNRAATSVTSLITQIIQDAASAEQEATDAEAADQKAYESFVSSSNQRVRDVEAMLALKVEAKAKAGSDLVATETLHADTSEELINSQSLESHLHEECDWLLKHFDVRNQQRQQEIEDILAAKAILSGSQ